jgi:serine/threonine protein phosphatase PrpC
MAMPGHLRVGCASHVGCVRTHNEDYALVLTAGQLGRLAPEDPFGVFIIADGMGGHQAGEVASMMAARTVARCLVTDMLVPYLSERDHASMRKPISDAMCSAIEAADQVVKNQVEGGGTTLTCGLVMGDHIHIAHVGDSRAYILSDGDLRQITRDHSLVDRLVEMGQISPAEALSHPHRNVLYRAVGQGDGIEVDIYLEAMPPASQVLLCSDGLWGMVTDNQIASILLSNSSPQTACEALVEAATQAGGADNVTVVLIAKE